MDDRVHAPQCVAKRGRIGEVAKRDLDAYALIAESPGIPNEAANGKPFRREPPEERRSDSASGSRQQDHGL